MEMFTLEVPAFELYTTRISHSQDKERVATDVLGIKCAINNAHHLKEFFAQLALPMGLEAKLGLFVPMGVVHILRSNKYAALIHNNNMFPRVSLLFLLETFNMPLLTSHFPWT